MIRASDLTVRLDDQPLLTGLDLEVQPGELVVLTGEDGCGTSTLLRVLAGSQSPTSGVVEGGPCSLLAQPPGDDWADEDLVGLLVGPEGLAALDALGASALVDRAMWTLSGGERQRVRLARALASDAPVLLLDEPLGYLDGAGVARVLDVLRLRAATGTAVLAVVKLDERGAAAADRVLVLDAGVLALPA